MRDFLKFFVLTFIFIFFGAFFVRAQDIGSVMPGINCGVPDNTANSQCCALKPVPTPNLQTGNAVIDVPLGAIMNAASGVSNGVIDKANQQLQQVAPVPACIPGAVATNVDASAPDCKCVTPTPPQPLSSIIPLCGLLTSGEQASCTACINQGAVWTSIGCVYADLGSFIKNNVFSWAIGLAGGFALLCIIFSAFQMQTSQGSPEKIKKAQEMLTSCIMGLMLIIFSVFILRLIGVKILGIPGFS